MGNQNIEFCGKLLGPGKTPFIVAEVGFNHNGDVAVSYTHLTLPTKA